MHEPNLGRCARAVAAAAAGAAAAADATAGGGPVPVVTTTVGQKDVPVDIEAIGNVEAYSTISVRAQVTGQLTEVLFNEGDSVKKGDHLFTIDPRAYQAQLEQALANLKRDEALLGQAEAQLGRDAANAEFAQLTSERQAQLTERGIISKDQAQQAGALAEATAATVKADKASIESARAQIVAQEAAVNNARVALSYTTSDRRSTAARATWRPRPAISSRRTRPS